MDCKLRSTFATPQENKPTRKQIMEGIYGSYRHKKISHSTKEVTDGWPAWDDSNVRQTRLRRPVLYPAELQADMINHSTFWKIFQITFYAETIPKTIPDIV